MESTNDLDTLHASNHRFSTVENPFSIPTNGILNNDISKNAIEATPQDKQANIDLNKNPTYLSPNDVTENDRKEAWADNSVEETCSNAQLNQTSGETTLDVVHSLIDSFPNQNDSTQTPNDEKISALLNGIEAESNRKAEEERIRELLAYMEVERRRQELENWRRKGTCTPLEDINEADEDDISVSVDSRPSTRQQQNRPTSGRSRSRSSRGRPVSARSRGSVEINGGESGMPDWFIPVRPPSVMEMKIPDITLESGGKYRILLENDTEKCLVSGMTFLESGDLVLTDKGNEKVKFVDKDFKFISQLPMSEPWDVCSVGNDIYVSFGTGTIQHLFVKDMVLELGKTIEMTDKCYGIANFNNGIAVGLKTSEIHLMNVHGEVKRIIKIPKSEKGRNICPWHLSVTKKFDILVTDPDIRTVCCLNSKGELLFRYPDMSNPRATISDSSGNIFLVGLNKDTNLVMQILRKSEDSVICMKSIVDLEALEFEPCAVSLRHSDGLLVLGGMRHALKRYKIV